VAEFPQVKLFHEEARRGKSAAINRAVTYAKGEILIFNDANTLLNGEAVMNIARHYSKPEIGGVAGEKKVVSTSTNPDQATDKEGLYWRYESFLKQIDSDFYSVVGAAGELFSVRSSLYEAVPDNVILDDFIISMRVVQKGYRVIYEKKACATELPSVSIEDEKKRKVRIAAGGFQSIVMLKGLLAFWRHPRLTFLYISHRLLRWTLTPLCLILAFFCNAILAYLSGDLVWSLLFIGQLLFYAMAIMGSFDSGNKKGVKLLKIAYYFVFMNVSVILGFIRFMKGKQSAVWEKASRTLTNP
jgi:biofilm PGA synthesis N-glycosyltransferase PgaC